MKITGQRIDRRIQVLPPTHGVRRFKNGFSNLSQISGTERKNMAKILLGCVVGYMSHKGIMAVTGLLDFIYLAQYEAHCADTFGYMKKALKQFYDNRDFFIEIGVRKHFNIPKFHSLTHYIRSIKMFGTTDNYNTEMFERLHIDFAKMGWRASNKRDEFPQMINWLDRQEKVSMYETYQSHRTDHASAPPPSPSSDRSVDMSTGSDGPTSSSSSVAPATDDDSDEDEFIPVPISSISLLPTTPHTSEVSISKHPAYPNAKISLIERVHDARDFGYYLKLFINQYLPNGERISPRQLDNFQLPFTKVDVYNLFRFHPSPINDSQTSIDVVRAMRKSSKYPHGRFDTVIVIVGKDAESTALQGTRVGRIRVIFRFPKIMDTNRGPREVPNNWEKGPMAYVEWFTSIPANGPSKNHGLMYKIKRPSGDGVRPGAIVPLTNIRQSCMLMPGYTVRQDVEDYHKAEKVLDQVDTFFINNWRDKYSYQTIY
ncbi:hypothetical protein CVT24_004179 [Panaeolus cyanescens]|uniref:Uncharacterized protein n=1 Tax=Panaeolus cyanescens TaxID=181874 RepID=A0A409YXC7_9AGAR|nr:hypothetical protein CVT24_004179 [Panaeolus cyanescens]